MTKRHTTTTFFALTAALLLAPLAALAAGDESAAKPSPAIPGSGKPAVEIPFPESLRRADVELAAMKNGQHESLILGNGDLYGIVWEKGNGLFMRITKNDIWDARVDTAKDGGLPRVDPVTRKVTGPEGAPPSYALPYPQPRCAVALRLGPAPEKMSGHLNLEKAALTIRSGEQTHTVLRILHQQNVLLIHGPQPVVLEEIKAATLPAAKLGETDGVSWLLMNLPGDIDYKGMDYAVAVATNGDVKAVSLVTSFDPGASDVLTRAISLARTAAKQEQGLIAKHEQAWHDYWARCGVKLADETVERWWYRMLYFAGTVCRPGTAPVPILPPLATDETPWHADFHHNYNTWQAYWPLPAVNHPELVDPWISYNLGMIPRYKNLAKVTYGLEGLHVPISSFLHEPNPANCKSKNQRQMSMNPWGLTIGLQAMTLQNMWQKYQCDQDVAYMKTKIHPFLREVATIYIALMEKCQRDAKGKVLLGPSFSPEHRPMGIFNCPFDIAYVHYTFDAMIEAAETLQVDCELAGKCRELKKLLPDYPTTVRNGEKIVVDWVGGDYIAEHNITVPAAPVFPADQVTWFSDEAQKKLFRQTIQQTRFRDANAHVMFNIARARLSMPEGFTEGRRWFASRELPNGLFVWDGHAHGTFMGEMIGIAGLINEYLLQSVDNKIRLFPCWPADQDAAFSRMRAQGGFMVSASFKDGRVESTTIESVARKQLVLLSPWKTMQVNGRKADVSKDGLVVIETKPGDVLVLRQAAKPVEPPPAETKEARDARMAWWREARFGMFIHWGLYAIPGGVWKDKVHKAGYSEWIMFDEKIPAKEYDKLAAKFNPVKFDAKAWIAVAKQAGMKYMVLTTKHHDGFSMFQSSLTPYNVADATPFKRDVTRELSDACRDSGMRFGCYYSIDRDWKRPQGPGNRYKQANVWDFPESKREDFDRYFATFAKPQVEELLTKYRPDLLWFDEIDMKTDTQVEDLYQSIRRLRPECVINSRIQGCRFPEKIPPPHCDYISTGDNEIADRKLGFEWENPGSMNTSYGYNANDHNWVSAATIVSRLVEIVSKGGNYLLNVGPTPEGIIPQPCIDRLSEVGEWMEVNGEAIYGTSAWRVCEEKDEASGSVIRFTAKGDSVYVFCPFGQAGELTIKTLGEEQLPGKQIVSAGMLGSAEKMKWSRAAGGLKLTVPPAAPGRFIATFRVKLRNRPEHDGQ